jgi:hypothetical protein
MHGRIGLMRNVVYKEALLWSFMHLLNGSMRSYIHDVQLFKIECSNNGVPTINVREQAGFGS